MSVWRWLASAGAIIALLAIGIQPTWRRPTVAGAAVLVTPGADAGTVRRLVDSLGAAPVFTDPSDVRGSGSRTIQQLHVVGWGLDSEQWLELGSTPVVAHPTGPAAGLARVSWTAELVLGDALEIEGRVSGTTAATTVFLADPSGRRDSVRSAADGAFHIGATPHGTGPQLYVLQAGPAGRPATRETLAVNVIAPPRRRMLMLEAAPSFETSALRDWLARRGCSIAIRTAVSRDRFRTEFVNRDRVALTPLTDRLLAQFDIVQIDGRTLAALTTGERAVLRRAVTEKGLGVLIVPDTALFDTAVPFSDRAFFFDFALRSIRDLEQRTVRPVWAGMGAVVPTAVPADPYTLVDRFGVESVIEDGSGAAEAQVAARGAGRIGVSLVSGPARWLRTGQHDVYSSYWARLLAAVTNATPDRIEVETAGPWLINRPLVIRVASASERTVAVVQTPSGNSDSVFLAPDPLTPETSRGVYWPRDTGWHAVGGPAGSAFYVQPVSDWGAHQASERLDAMARHTVAQSGSFPAGTTMPVPIPRIWFFGLFVLSAAVLWSTRRPTAVAGASVTATAS